MDCNNLHHYFIRLYSAELILISVQPLGSKTASTLICYGLILKHVSFLRCNYISRFNLVTMNVSKATNQDVNDTKSSGPVGDDTGKNTETGASLPHTTTSQENDETEAGNTSVNPKELDAVKTKASISEPDTTTKQCDEANLHYEDGICIYTEPESKCQYVWDETKQEWMPRNNSSSFSDKDYEFDGKMYTYTDKETSK